MLYNMAMNFIKKSWYKFLTLSYIFLTPIVSFAVQITGSSDGAGKIRNPLGADGPDTIPKFIKMLLEGVLKIGIPIVALAIIYCGFLFVEARGNSEKLTKAKDALLYTLIGAGILLGSWAIAEMISATVTGLK